MKFLIAFLFFLFFFCAGIHSQNFEVGLFAGGTSFMGDIDVINAKTFLPQVRFGTGLLAKYNFNEHFAARFQFTNGSFYGDEKKYPTSSYRALRGLSFTSNISDISTTIEWHPIGLNQQIHLTNSNMFVSFYGLTGIGAANFNPVVNFSNLPDNLIVNQTKNYPRNALIIPFGAGVSWHLNDNFTLNSEIVARKIFSDYADGIKINPDSKTFHDYYFLGGVSLTYTILNKHIKKGNFKYQGFNGGVNCPRF